MVQLCIIYHIYHQLCSRNISKYLQHRLNASNSLSCPLCYDPLLLVCRVLIVFSDNLSCYVLMVSNLRKPHFLVFPH